jgi:hypothetical protein
LGAEIIDWLTGVSSTVVRLSLFLFVAVNLAAAGAFFARRDRVLVQKWTAPWLAVNAILIGAGLGTPMLVGLTKLAFTAFTGMGEAATAVPTSE